MTYPDGPLELREQLESDLPLSPGLHPYRRRTVDLTTARAAPGQREDWVGDFLYVEELAGTLELAFGNSDSPRFTLREGEVYKLTFGRVYLVNSAQANAGTARIITGTGAFDLVATHRRRPGVLAGEAIQTAHVNATTSGNTQLVAAVAGKRIWVTSMIITNNGSSKALVGLQSASTGIWGPQTAAADGGGFSLEPRSDKVCVTEVAEALNVNLSANGDVNVDVQYVEIT